MGRQETFGFILIAAVLMAWMWFTSPQRQTPPPEPPAAETAVQRDAAPSSLPAAPAVTAAPVPVAAADTLGRYFAGTDSGTERTITVETDRYIAELSTHGGTIVRWTLKGYSTWDGGHPVQLVNGRSDYSVLFTTTDGKIIDTKHLFFQTSSVARRTLTGSDEATVEMVLTAREGRIVKTFTFRNGRYDFTSDIRFEGMQNVVANYEYQVLWEHGVKYTEFNSVDESNSAAAFTYGGGELKEVNASSVGDNPKEDPSGQTDWVAVRSKYFAAALLSEDRKASGAYLEGTHTSAPDNGSVERYAVALKYPFKNTMMESAKLTVYLGPLEYSTLESYGRGLHDIMSLGWSWIRPLTVYLFIPLFNILHSFIPNYGLVIIVFSLVIKLALHPLTRSSMRSMRNMQKLQPLMQELREKYQNDPQTMNLQTMKLYKDYGVNPAGGCLPLLLQMPILFALYSLFSSSIELRHAPFVWWITDLSTPDVLVPLPFSVPLLGNFISGLTLAMGITMYVQQKQTVTDPTQKALVWMMPLMMTVMFNHFPSGLNLYYFVFNILSIGQQYYFNQSHKDEPLKKVPENKRKSGFMERLAKNMPKPPKR
ncbi:MAG: membrane protein insertase YidC [Bacteroidetes bacterium]|nr:MAG: membrane protein insertase YidC [Bacteroidota bacterium]